ncbi:MAG TPA: right-handed parallel beta-helix repeat-containing protein [Candidatus Acidoferrales bacterium]|nr:right-handed parallel beta-helix repeat-containing protein [Candidatus Acidoferrales bacterium]
MRIRVIDRRIVSLMTCGMFALAVAVGLATSASAAPKPGNSCSSSITACGCIMDKRGSTYTVMNDLNDGQGLTPNGNCLEISADHVLLDLMGNALIGSGSGTAIVIQKTAQFAVIQGTDPNEAAQAIVNSWNIGIEDDGNNATIELFRQIGGNQFNPHGNTTYGVVLNGVSNTTVDDFNASFNGQDGLLVVGGGSHRFMNFDTTNNGADGVALNASNGNTLFNCTTTGNGGQGVLMISADSNQVFTGAINGNQKNGILLGCGKSAGASCGSHGSNFNRVSDSGANGNQAAGIVIDKGSSANAITSLKAQGNGGSFDAIDSNSRCDDDTWFNNTFGTVSQSCIH